MRKLYRFIQKKLEHFDSNDLSSFLAIIVIFAVSALIIVSFAYLIMRIFGIDSNDLGVFGDFIGGSLNPVLSFLSLIAILFTIVIQNRELTATRAEISASRAAQEEQ